MEGDLNATYAVKNLGYNLDDYIFYISVIDCDYILGIIQSHTSQALLILR